MRPAGAGRTEGDVDALLREHSDVALGDQFDFAGRDGLVDLSARRADQLTGNGLLSLVELADGAVGQRKRTLVTGVSEPGQLELIKILGFRDRLERDRDSGFYLAGAGRIDRCRW